MSPALDLGAGAVNRPPAVPLFCTQESLRPLIAEVLERQAAVVESGRYILGPEVEAFEEEFAAYIGRRHCVGVASGTDALTIGLRSLGIGPGDEVIVPGLSFFATAEAVVHAGATPVFADIDGETFCLSAATVAPVISPRTRAIVPVHLFGNVAPLGELYELAGAHGLTILEDSAQAAGASLYGRMAGALGDVSAFSFYPGKNLGAFGDAGALLTDSDEIAAAARSLRVHGQAERWQHTEVGYTSRLDAIQAAALRVLLPHLDSWTDSRRAAAAAYAEAGLGLILPGQHATEGALPAHHLQVVLTPDREQLSIALARHGIESRGYYTTPLHQQPAMAEFRPTRPLANAERLAQQGLAIPMGPDLSAEEAAAVVEAIRSELP
jgi:dTDP-4-amino-4,6-dideoxygalactose transaminase